MSLLGWLTEIPLLTSICSCYIPMHPNSAIAFIALGAATLVLDCPSRYRVFQWLSALLSLCVIMLGALTLTHYFKLFTFNIDRAFIKYPHEPFLGKFPDGMSSLTAGNFILAGVSILLRFFPPHRRLIRNSASCLSTLVIMVGFVVIFGYVYRSPILYGGNTTPMALNTACAFVCAGIGLVLLMSTECVPLSLFIGTSVRARLMRNFFPVLILTVILYDIVSHLFLVTRLINPSVVYGVNTIIFFGIIGLIVLLVSKMVGGSIDNANAMRARTEAALRESEERFRTMFEATGDGIILADKQTRMFRYVNNAICLMLGYSRDELTKMGVQDIHPAKDVAHIMEQFSLMAAGKTDSVINIPVKRKDGRTFYADLKTSALILNGKEFLMGIFRDVTERKQMESALIAREKQHQAISELTTDFIYHIVVGTDNNMEIDWIGDGFTKITGHTLRDVRFPDLWKNVIPPKDLNPIFGLFKEILQGKQREMEFRLRHKNGEILWLKVYGKPEVNADGRIVGIIGAVSEISGRKKAEEELRLLNETLEQKVIERAKELAETKEQLYHAQKLDSIGRLAGGVAHDFNNILMAIMGYSSLAEMEMEEGSPARGYIQKIFTSSNKAKALTQSLLAFSRRQPLSLSPVNLNSIISHLQQLLFRTARENIKYKLMLADRDIQIMADYDKIEQALMNLTNNAVDAMPDGGVLTIRTDVIVIDREMVNNYGLHKHGAYGVITVSDTGIGMDDEIKGKIFEPFFTTKERGRGTGLGLPIVYGVVKQHNGHIEVISAPDKGSTFNIYLPIIEHTAVGKDTDSAAPNIRPNASAKAMTILLAEDADDVRLVITKILERAGYRVISAINGEDAINKFEENKDWIAMLLFDVMMPVLSGKDAYNRIKKLAPDIKVIFMSGYSESIDTNREIQEEGLAFIQKPVDSNKLLQMLGEVSAG